MADRFTSSDVIKLTGISARQLQWWDERKVVVPEREGHRRLYGLDDVTEIAVICDLRRRGFSLQRVRKVIRLLQREFHKRLVETVGGQSECHLLTDGQRIYLSTSAEQVIDLLKNSQQPVLSVCLSDMVRQIQTHACKLSPDVEKDVTKKNPASVRERKTARLARRATRAVP
ncbi:MAG TPA: MerR family transcriptional regulator [Terriglobales bacterium]|nr:MerR family transcriptional regulator [Terriglobales bacterium]